ncbi:abortive infection family protein [Gloeothece verrucosa]|uniref:Abortive infection protein-like C-terminal domain-containing protein n=1 Tax=Gloeothece verrucosa (strain PCC 7822) TaxID=497965 RepID=E0UAI5_GLOV7|nr:abortive infection family protein [Gloeothece verrucosa]ADN12726.1 hypothetical protein Cyan7822_0694 [Gloeothece verrucosa PCC 7822]
MSELDKDNLRFICHGAREVLELSVGAVHIEKLINALERAVEEDPGLAFDLAKSLVESICKTILSDRNDESKDKLLELPKLVKYTTKQLNLIPEEHLNPEVEQSFQSVINGLITTIHGLCEIRRLEGTASHGRNGYIKSLEPLQALFAARVADAIANLLFKTHKNNLTSSKIPYYEDNPEFNIYLDSLYECSIAGLPYKTSDVLFKIDQQAYINFLQEYLSDLSVNPEDLSNEDEKE